MVPNLAHLRTFLAVADAGSLVCAAQTLEKAQSAVSRSILELEKSLGVRLFNRHAAGVSLTTVAESIITRVRETVESLVEWNGPRFAPSKHLPLYRSVPQDALNARRLEMFTRLVHCRHMPTVAKQMSVTQPAVSTAIAVLESCAHERLFMRSSSGLVPGGRAIQLAEISARALRSAGRILEEVCQVDGEARGTLVIGALGNEGASVLPRVIAAFHNAYPNASIGINNPTHGDLLAGLRAGAIDVAIGALHEFALLPDLEIEPLCAEEVYVVARAGHRCVNANVEVASLLEDERWIVPATDNAAPSAGGTFNFENAIPPCRVAIRTCDVLLTRQVLLQTDLLAAVPAGLAQSEMLGDGVVKIPVTLPVSQTRVGVARIRAAHRPSVADTFWTALQILINQDMRCEGRDVSRLLEPSEETEVHG